MDMISIDTETTGLDLYHGSKPFLVTIATEESENIYFEWDVNPQTREPIVEYEDLVAIQKLISTADSIVLQNAKFDVTALQKVFLDKLDWDWNKVHDTLIAAHLLDSSKPKDLTALASRYLGIDIKPLDDTLKKACNEARAICKRSKPDWAIAKRELDNMPSAKNTVWKYDAWLPRQVAKTDGYDADHPWYTVCSNYANTDSTVCLEIFKVMIQEIKKIGLWNIYKERLRLLPVIAEMEKYGVSISATRLKSLTKQYKEESSYSFNVCTEIAKCYGVELKLPKGGNNKSLTQFVFNQLGLPTVAKSKKTGSPSLNKSVLEYYEATLKPNSLEYSFIRNLRSKRKRDTALSYMSSYKKFWLPIGSYNADSNGSLQESNNGRFRDLETCNWYRLHPNVNPTATATLRCSSNNPNEQNISKQEGFNLRYCFGPAPGREWWSLDAKNIELRIPAYEANEEEMVDLFEHPNDPPYFGSNHLLVFDILHPEKFKKYGADCKKVYASTWYQWTKNGNFAVQYGAVETSGTADRAYKVPGAQKIIQRRFKKIAELNKRLISQADIHGYVETLPDKTVDPNRGYPLKCPRTESGKALPTVPLNYHVQGTAMWVVERMMVEITPHLEYLSKQYKEDYKIVMQIHDEIVLDFPYKKGMGNLPKVKKIKLIMDSIGYDLVPSIPLPVGIEYHEHNWSEGVSVC